MSNYTKVVIALVAIAVVVIAISISGDKADKPIKIGFIGALSGTAASYGESQRDGAMIAVDEINSLGGVSGRMLELVVEDGQCRGEPAASAAQKLIQVDKVNYIVGGSCSTEVLSYLPIVDQNEVVTIVSTASNFKITDDSDYIFRHVPHDNYLGEKLADFVRDDYEHIGVITENLDFPIGLRDPFVERYGAIGGNVVVDELYPADETDFRTILVRAMKEDPQALFLNTQSDSTASRIAQQARELGYDGQFYAAYWTGPGFVEAGPWVEGSILVSTPQVDMENPKARALASSYKKRFGKEANYPYYTAAAYDSVYVIARAIEESEDDSATVRDYLHEMSVYMGAAAAYQYDHRGDAKDLELSLLRVVDGKLVSVKQ